jgi:hypothetical protein
MVCSKVTYLSELEEMKRVLKVGRSYEVIVTTQEEGSSDQVRTNAAAIGLTMTEYGALMRVYMGSNTFANLLATGTLGINVITMEEVEFLAIAALRGWGTDEAEFGDEHYDQSMDFPFLNVARAWFLCEARKIVLDMDAVDEYGPAGHMSFLALPMESRVASKDIVPIERDRSPIVEALVMATRWRMAKGERKADLGTKMDSLLEVAKKDGNEAEMRAVRLLERYIGQGS